MTEDDDIIKGIKAILRIPLAVLIYLIFFHAHAKFLYDRCKDALTNETPMPGHCTLLDNGTMSIDYDYIEELGEEKASLLIAVAVFATLTGISFCCEVCININKDD